MRSLLAAVALLLAAVVGTVALAAYVAHQTVLDPRSSGHLVASALDDPSLRHRILAGSVPGYDGLPSAARARVDQVAEDSELQAAIRKVRVDAQGRVHLSRLRQAIEEKLRAEGEPQLAAELEAVGGPATMRLPSPVTDGLATARSGAWTLATGGGVVALALLLSAVLVARNRRRALHGAGWTVLVACGLTGLLWYFAPKLTRLAGYQAWSDAVAAARQSYAPAVFSSMLPVILAGVALLAVSFLLPGRRRF